MNLNDIFSDVRVVTVTDDENSKVTKLDGLDGLISFFDNEVKKMEEKENNKKEGQPKIKTGMDDLN